MNQWIAVEHYRLHTIEEWPDSPYKEATLAAIHAALTSLASDPRAGAPVAACNICRTRRRVSPVLGFPDRWRMDARSSTNRAA